MSHNGAGPENGTFSSVGTGRRMMVEESMIRVSLDRIEEGLAVLITEDRTVLHLPAQYLPSGSREGDVMDVIFRLNPQETEELAERVEDLQKRLLERTARRHAREAEE
jgi:hypothetical protein